MLNKFKNQLDIYEAKIRFIEEFINGTMKLVNEEDDVIEGYLHVDEELGEVELGSGGTIPSAQECVNRLEKIKQRVRYHSG